MASQFCQVSSRCCFGRHSSTFYTLSCEAGGLLSTADRQEVVTEEEAAAAAAEVEVIHLIGTTHHLTEVGKHLASHIRDQKARKLAHGSRASGQDFWAGLEQLTSLATDAIVNMTEHRMSDRAFLEAEVTAGELAGIPARAVLPAVVATRVLGLDRQGGDNCFDICHEVRPFVAS